MDKKITFENLILQYLIDKISKEKREKCEKK